jgi:hypothetical protein
MAGCITIEESMRWIRRSWLTVLLLGSVVACGTPTDSDTSTPETSIRLDDTFEGASLGNWAVVPPSTVRFSLRMDTNASTRYFFSFRVIEANGLDVSFSHSHALEVASLESWGYTQPVISYDDGQTWTRITHAGVVGAAYVFQSPIAADTAWVALKIPYNFSKWMAYSAAIESNPLVSSIENIGSSLDGNPVHLVTITDPAVASTQKNGIWVVARHHPGEPGGSYMVEGFMRWLLGGSAQASELLRRAEVFIVPFMNPDGVLAGNQRVNLAGLDLNRQWTNPDPATAPTVAATVDRITAYRDGGGDTRILIDFHSAPTGRSNFFYYNEAESSTQALHDEIVDVIALAAELNPDFIGLSGSVARPVDMGQRARSWGFYALQTHGLTVESSGNDVTYGPNVGKQQTIGRLLDLGAAVGMAVAEELYDIPR